ncbi:TadE/TadG family type IV pilus assembly protein [Taklimakanibacter deserti]|uniref:TadE/TadG family type IV pilus assembly protein n=1 Tax=Taklimakanibacter deserti TaxID=2267839 RepID=UPI000E65801D
MRQLHAKIRRFIRDRQGVAAIELALIAPVLLLLYFGTVDLGNWYMAHRRLVVAGSTVTDLTTQSNGQVTKAEIDAFWNGIGRIIAPLKLADVKMTMRDFRKKNGAVQQQWSYSANGGSACGAALTAADMQALGTNEMTDGNDILVASVCTTIAPIALQMFGFTSIDMKYRISMRPRIGKTLDCTNC